MRSGENHNVIVYHTQMDNLIPPCNTGHPEGTQRMDYTLLPARPTSIQTISLQSWKIYDPLKDHHSHHPGWHRARVHCAPRQSRYPESPSILQKVRVPLLGC